MTKPTRRKKRSFRWLTLVIIGAVVLGAVQMAGRIDRLIDMNNQVAECQVRLAEAQAVYDDKMATIDLLDNPAYLERVARENLGMVKQGETIVSVVRSDAPAQTADDTSASEDAEE
ncbi:MAG: septum formation initiator family protein [Firmicutes bacterium]|jgi:cell division protein FtsB|nr:septum formation initiator family protein [Bacillota bacterium]MBR0178917.1 septum formation initiator family protein [Bacillota bacterium]